MMHKNAYTSSIWDSSESALRELSIEYQDDRELDGFQKIFAFLCFGRM